MHKQLVVCLIGACLTVAPRSGAADSANSAERAGSNDTVDAARVQQRLAGLAVPFQANVGQHDARVAYVAQTFAGALFVTRDGQLVHSFPGRRAAETDSGTGRKPVAQQRGRGWTLTETLINARPLPRGELASATHMSRFIGNDPAQWQSDVPTFDRVSLGEAWPGIDVELAARGNNVEKLFTVAPGADPRRIAIRLRGAKRLEVAADGSLIAHTGNGPVSFTAPAAWQDIDGRRRPVSVAYALAGQRYGFTLGDYDRTQPVVIDPLLQATYLGGAGWDFAISLAVDESGNVFVSGYTYSPDFPGTAGGAQPANGGGIVDAFVAKLSNGLTTLIQATYLGGTGGDSSYALALDASGNVFVAGVTSSPDFPGTAGGAQASAGGDSDAFVAKLSNGLTTLIQATYLGGSASDYTFALALDASGSVFLAGGTTSADFPGTAGGAQPTWGEGGNAFLAKLNNGLTTLTQATYLGGSGGAEAHAIALDASGNVFLAGSTAPDFPGTAGGAQASAGGDGDAFVAKLNNGLTTLIQATYLGGRRPDLPYALTLDASGNVFVAGYTYSDNFPGTAGGAQPTFGGNFPNTDAFVAKLNNGLTTLIQATYLGGSGSEAALALALDASGNVFVAGGTGSSDFPGTAGGAQPYGVGIDAFVAKLNNSLTTLTQATYLGGSQEDGGDYMSLVVDAVGNLFVAGSTNSTDFPGTAGGAQAANGGTFDAFVAKLSADLRAPSARLLVPDGTSITQTFSAYPETRWFAMTVEPGKTYVVEAVDSAGDLTANALGSVGVYAPDGVSPPTQANVDCTGGNGARAPAVDVASDGVRCVIHTALPTTQLIKRPVYVKVTRRDPAAGGGSQFKIRVRESTIYGRWLTAGYDYHIEIENTTGDPMCVEVAQYPASGLTYTPADGWSGVPASFTLTVPAFGAVKQVIPSGSLVGADSEGALRIGACASPTNLVPAGLQVSTYAFDPSKGKFLQFFTSTSNQDKKGSTW